MEFQDLPLEIILEIVTYSPETWKASVLSIPLVYRNFDVSLAKKRMTVKSTLEYYDMKETICTLAGKLHGEKEPAEKIEMNRKGRSVFYEKWYKHGILHREDGPAFLCLVSSTINNVNSKYAKQKIEKYSSLCFLKIPDTPFFYKEVWLNNGRKERKDGPFFIKLSTGYQVCPDTHIFCRGHKDFDKEEKDKTRVSLRYKDEITGRYTIKKFKDPQGANLH